MHKVRTGLQARFLLVLLLLLLLLFSSLATVLVRQNTATQRNQLSERSKSFASLATKPIGDAFLIYRSSGSYRIDQRIEQFTNLDSDIEGVAIIDSNDKIVYSTGQSKDSAISSGLSSSFTPKYSYNDRALLQQVTQPYIEDTGLHRYSLVYKISSSSVDDNTKAVLGIIVVGCLVGLGIMLALSYLLIHRFFIRPIAAVSQAALQISTGNYSTAVNSKRTDEIGDLARSVNTMSQSLQSDIAKLKELDAMKGEFMMITAHNLRTPLSIIKGYMETLSDLLHDNHEIASTIETIQLNVERLGVFTEDILTISTIENGGQILHLDPTALQPLLETLANEFKEYCDDKQLAFDSNLNVAGEVRLSKTHLRGAIWNVLDNAVKFTKAGGKIAMAAKQEGHDYVITITDTGIGIAPEEVEKLFTKFHRGTSTMQYDYEGVGIGLYATKLIVQQHQGNVQASSHLDKGTTVTIRLPIFTKQNEK